ncbi:hypothetical protein KI440_02590 [Candidatus Saccharibacteria bacterium TM7i]|nr:hypothetical protein KI440_02590 [Candidatus Saccharibacteria bacterium TM7i]
MAHRVVYRNTAPSMKPSGPPPEPPVPAGCIHVRAYVREVWGRERKDSGAKVTSLYGKNNDNLKHALGEQVRLFIPINPHNAEMMARMADTYPSRVLFLPGVGMTVLLPPGALMLAYDTFAHPHSWNRGEARSIVTFFVDENTFQLTVKSNGRIRFCAMPRSTLAGR